ncbi:MAG TPA: hypothetical protein VGG11_21935 [Xanthobacteraceae bacterium]|jgi:hypothetical protein
MSFGKRGQSPPEEVSSQSRHQSSATNNPLGLLATKSEGPDVVLFGAAFVAIAAFVVIFFELAPGQSSRADSPAATAPIVTSDVAPLDTVRQRLTTGEDGRTFEFAIITSPSARCFDRLNSVRPWRHPGWTNRALDPAKGILKFEYEVAGLALNCLLTEDESRFCKADERAKIVNAISFYLKKYRRELAWKKRASNAPETAQGRMYKDLAERMKKMDPAGGDDDNVDDAAQLFAGIESVTAAGYFNSADFDGSSAPELATHIRPAVSTPCG